MCVVLAFALGLPQGLACLNRLSLSLLALFKPSHVCCHSPSLSLVILIVLVH